MFLEHRNDGANEPNSFKEKLCTTSMGFLEAKFGNTAVFETNDCGHCNRSAMTNVGGDVLFNDRSAKIATDTKKVSLGGMSMVLLTVGSPVGHLTQFFSACLRTVGRGIELWIIASVFCGIVILVPGVFFASVSAFSQELVSASDKFVVVRSFSNIVIPEQQISSIRVFFDAGSPSANDVSELDAIKATAIRLLATRAKLVPEQADANLLVRTRMYQTTNYAIRNPSREPAHGFVLVGACKLPIVTMASDCGSLTYYYFADYQDVDIFQNVFNMWLISVFPHSDK